MAETGHRISKVQTLWLHLEAKASDGGLKGVSRRKRPSLIKFTLQVVPEGVKGATEFTGEAGVAVVCAQHSWRLR